MNSNKSSMFEHINTKHNRKIFILVILLLIIVIFSVQFYFIPIYYGDPLPEIKDILSNVFSGLFTTILTTFGIAGLIFYLTPPIMNRVEFNFVSPHIRANILKTAREDTVEWWFSGGLGRYTRTVTLPKLSLQAKNSNNHKSITLQIIDPSNTDLVNEYVAFRTSLKTGRTDPWWNSDNIKAELYAFIISCHYWSKSEPLFNIRLGLKSSFSIFRIDMSSDFVIVTKEDPLEPALKFDQKTFLFDSYKQELIYSLKQSKEINVALLHLPWSPTY